MKTSLEPLVIISTVADFFKVPVAEIIGTSRKREFVRPRHLSMYFVDMFTGGSLNFKGSFFGKDHDDIVYARHQVNNQAWAYREYRNELNKILSSLVRIEDFEFERYKQFDTDKT